MAGATGLTDVDDGADARLNHPVLAPELNVRERRVKACFDKCNQRCPPPTNFQSRPSL